MVQGPKSRPSPPSLTPVPPSLVSEVREAQQILVQTAAGLGLQFSVTPSTQTSARA